MAIVKARVCWRDAKVWSLRVSTVVQFLASLEPFTTQLRGSPGVLDEVRVYI